MALVLVWEKCSSASGHIRPIYSISSCVYIPKVSTFLLENKNAYKSRSYACAFKMTVQSLLSHLDCTFLFSPTHIWMIIIILRIKMSEPKFLWILENVLANTCCFEGVEALFLINLEFYHTFVSCSFLCCLLIPQQLQLI